MANKSLNVNGKRVSITYDDPQMPLLYVLRDNLGLRGPVSAAVLVSAAPAPSISMAPLFAHASHHLPP